MINLLPYNKRALLKSSYKKRLTVVTFVSVSIALMPLVLVLLLLSYLQRMDYSILNTEFDNLKLNNQDSEVDKLTSDIKNFNAEISNFQNSLNKTKNISQDIVSAVNVRPSDVIVNNFSFSKQADKTVLVIMGVSGTRDSIIKYGSSLDKKNNGICSDVSLPVTTYAKKVDVPFSITCSISNENK